MEPNRRMLAALCAAWVPIATTAIDQRSFIELLEHRVIDVKPVGLGGHSGESLRVTVRNNSGAPISTSIPVGWVFTSQVPEVQDLIVVREELLAIAGGASRSVVCRAFCCEASGSGPEEGEVYRAGRPGSAKLIALAQAIARSVYPDEIVQNAVWVLSDSNDIASMGAMDSTAMDSLRLVVSELSGQPAPLYSMQYVEEEGRVCSQRPSSVQRHLRYTTMGTVFTAVVIDRTGHVVQVLHAGTALDAGTHTLAFELDVNGWPPGNYAIHAHSTDRAGVHRMPFSL